MLKSEKELPFEELSLNKRDIILAYCFSESHKYNIPSGARVHTFTGYVFLPVAIMKIQHILNLDYEPIMQQICDLTGFDFMNLEILYKLMTAKRSDKNQVITQVLNSFGKDRYSLLPNAILLPLYLTPSYVLDPGAGGGAYSSNPNIFFHTSIPMVKKNTEYTFNGMPYFVKYNRPDDVYAYTTSDYSETKNWVVDGHDYSTGITYS